MGGSGHSSCLGSTSGRSIRKNVLEFTTRMDAHHLRGQPTAMARMVKHVGETGGGPGLCPPWGLFVQSAQIACCVWMQHRLEGASSALPTFLLLRRAFWGFSNCMENGGSS
jgi:hypothetical protein